MFETPVKTFSIPSSRRSFTSHSRNISRIAKYQKSETIGLMKDNFESSTFSLTASDVRLKVLNPSKCNVIRVTHLSNRHTPFKFQYKLHGKVLGTVDTTKYLGINLSHDLRWNDHVNAITTKANKTLNFLRRNLRTCSDKSKEQACKALLRPIVEYSATVWDPHVAKNIQQVEMVQRRAARWVLGGYDRLDSVTDMLSSLKWRSLELRRSDARLCCCTSSVMD